jgi:hypothetical protein
MKKNFFLSICVMLVLASCQKETTDLVNKSKPTPMSVTSSAPKGVSLIKDGYPYPVITQANSLGMDNIGWFVDVSSVQANIAETKGPVVYNLGDASLYCGGITSVDMLAGQNILMGTLSYANDNENLYVTYTANADWYMSEVHLYVGSLALSPKSGGGTPSPGRFPMKQSFSASNLAQEVTWTIPLSQLGFEFIIAAHASVLRVDIDGDVVAKETAWAAGSRFTSNKNWATYVTGYMQNCDGGGDPADLKNNTTN